MFGYSSSIDQFLASDTDQILGALARASQFDVTEAQRDAWVTTIETLQASLGELSGYLYLEFDIPRLGSRIDAVLILGPAIFPIEFKVGQRNFLRGDHEQAWDYALDLKNFHAGSHEASLFPILLASESSHGDTAWPPPAPDGIRPPRRTSREGLRRALDEALSLVDGAALDGEEWGKTPYRPTPTIIQAARALYAQHSVEAISRNDAGATNLTITSRRLGEIIESTRALRQKTIVFVTGVPGSGKTLVGLNIATQRRDPTSSTHAVFLSGNGALVAVLQEALVRDEVQRAKSVGTKLRKGTVATKVKAFIQNVHHFRDAGLSDPTRPPPDHVVIFDEAQRAWDLAKTSDFMRRKRNRAGFSESEPQVLIGYLDRHVEWAVVVCLVGGGQEIHTGEAGISEWLAAVRDHFPHWQVYISPELREREYSAASAIESLGQGGSVKKDSALHLASSLRSFRSSQVSSFVQSVLECETSNAAAVLRGVLPRYPIYLTRDLERAKDWLRCQARGSERYGLLASSAAERLKPHAIDVRVKVDPVQWFLHDASHTRSSYYLEDAATEFQVQGLEVDWACVTWDADVRHTGSGWSFHRFRGDQWINVKNVANRRYMLNAYRVLLTRARQGMVVFVPPGDTRDPTRPPAYYDDTFGLLLKSGIPLLTSQSG